MVCLNLYTLLVLATLFLSIGLGLRLFLLRPSWKMSSHNSGTSEGAQPMRCFNIWKNQALAPFHSTVGSQTQPYFDHLGMLFALEVQSFFGTPSASILDEFFKLKTEWWAESYQLSTKSWSRCWLSLAPVSHLLDVLALVGALIRWFGFQNLFLNCIWVPCFCLYHSFLSNSSSSGGPGKQGFLIRACLLRVNGCDQNPYVTV